jgi:pimeloyl-ACP methyl ester carboxylesterase
MKALISIFSLLLTLMVSDFAIAVPLLLPGAPKSSVTAPGPTVNSVSSFRGFVSTAPDHELFVDYVAPQQNMPTLIVLNGLTYNTTQWDQMVAPLVKSGVGVFRYDMFGMGQTMIHRLTTHGAPDEIIRYEDQVEDLKKLLTVMKIRAPYNFVGLSYGGGIAIAYGTKYPQDIANLILMAPYTQALASQDVLIRKLIATNRWMYPLLTDDQLYDMFLHQIIYATYPAAEPVIMKTPYGLEGVFRLVQGIRKFRPIDATSKLPKNVHLMVAGNDQYITDPAVLNSYWAAVPRASKASHVIVNDSEHKIPEAVPTFAAAWIYQIIVKQNPLLFQGLDFQAHPFEGIVTYNGGTIHVPKSVRKP